MVYSDDHKDDIKNTLIDETGQ